MTFSKQFSIAVMSKHVRSFGFQSFIKVLCHTMNTLCAGNTMGARVRRGEMLQLLKHSHSALLAQVKSMKDTEAFADLEKSKAVSVQNIADAQAAKLAAEEAQKES